MLVTDLHHFLDLPPDTPGPARRLAEHLSNIVRAATAGDAGTTWESALPCRRRPANRRCPGQMIVLRDRAATPIRWQCSVCDDEGIISNWEDSPSICAADGWPSPIPSTRSSSRMRSPRRCASCSCSTPTASDWYSRIRAHNDGAVLAATDDDLDELIGFVAAEANHEPNRRRQQRLDAAFDALNTAAQTPDGW